MQDLTTIRGDGSPAPSGPPPAGAGRASGKHGQPKMSRSASESAGSSGMWHSPPLASPSRASSTGPSPLCGSPGPCPTDLPPTQTFIRPCQASQGQSAPPVGIGSWPVDSLGAGSGHLHHRVPLPSSGGWVVVPEPNPEATGTAGLGQGSFLCPPPDPSLLGGLTCLEHLSASPTCPGSMALVVPFPLSLHRVLPPLSPCSPRTPQTTCRGDTSSEVSFWWKLGL